MRSKVKKVPESNGSDPIDVEALYVAFLQRYYDEGDHELGAKMAARLETALAASPELADSIRGAEICSLIAELRGDYQEAIHSREAEIRKILQLHALTVNTPGWAYVARQYDFSDVSDRLDLLALLYDRKGDTERAIATLRESRQYCQSHQIPFDGQDVLDELEKDDRKVTGRNGESGRKQASKRKAKIK